MISYSNRYLKIKEKLSENIKTYIYLGFKHIIPKGLSKWMNLGVVPLHAILKY